MSTFDDLHEARRMLSRGDHREAYEVLGGPVVASDAGRIAGEASSLIRDGLIGGAIDRISGFLNPRFGGRLRYAATGCEAAR